MLKAFFYGFNNPIKGCRVQFMEVKLFAQNFFTCPLVIEIYVECSVVLYCVNSMSELKMDSAGEEKLSLVHTLGLLL